MSLNTCSKPPDPKIFPALVFVKRTFGETGALIALRA